jgi:hypothetical protein
MAVFMARSDSRATRSFAFIADFKSVMICASKDMINLRYRVRMSYSF